MLKAIQRIRRFALGAAASGLMLPAVSAWAIETPTGAVQFDHPGGQAPAVSVDLPADLFRDFLGLGDAALEGVASGLLKNSGAQGEEVKLAAEHLAALRQLIGTAQGAVQEVRVRVYNEEGSNSPGADVAQHYISKLQGTAWDKIAEVRDGNNNATVFLMRDQGSIKGVFVIASQGANQMVLANVLCDISPDRIKQLTEQGVTMGLKVGGDEAVKQMVNEILGHHQRRQKME